VGMVSYQPRSLLYLIRKGHCCSAANWARYARSRST
jgi:hypothetical protein